MGRQLPGNPSWSKAVLFPVAEGLPDPQQMLSALVLCLVLRFVVLEEHLREAGAAPCAAAFPASRALGMLMVDEWGLSRAKAHKCREVRPQSPLCCANGLQSSSPQCSLLAGQQQGEKQSLSSKYGQSFPHNGKIQMHLPSSGRALCKSCSHPFPARGAFLEMDAVSSAQPGLGPLPVLLLPHLLGCPFLPGTAASTNEPLTELWGIQL